MSEPEPPESIDYEANEMHYLREVMADSYNAGEPVYVSDGVWLVRLNSDRNLWELVVEGDGVDTFDADMVGTSSKLGLWIRRRVELHRSGDEEETVDEEPLPGGFQ